MRCVLSLPSGDEKQLRWALTWERGGTPGNPDPPTQLSRVRCWQAVHLVAWPDLDALAGPYRGLPR